MAQNMQQLPVLAWVKFPARWGWSYRACWILLLPTPLDHLWALFPRPQFTPNQVSSRCLGKGRNYRRGPRVALPWAGSGNSTAVHQASHLQVQVASSASPPHPRPPEGQICACVLLNHPLESSDSVSPASLHHCDHPSPSLCCLLPGPLPQPPLLSPSPLWTPPRHPQLIFQHSNQSEFWKCKSLHTHPCPKTL